MLKLILILNIILITPAFSFEKMSFLKGGISTSQAHIKAINGTKDNFFGIGFNTHFGYRAKRWDFQLSSYIYWGKIDSLEFKANNDFIKGTATYRNVSFAPIFKYNFVTINPIKNWFFYAGLGPSWSLQTVNFKQVNSTTTFNDDDKLTYQSHGGILLIGIEEKTKFKQEHPVYIEFLYSIQYSSRVKIVDATDATKINVRSNNEADQDVKGQFFMLSIGMTVF